MRDAPGTAAMRRLSDLSALSVPRMINERFTLLLWVRVGRAIVEAAGTSYGMHGGEAIWIPPGVVHAVRTEPGTIAIPVMAPVLDLRPPLDEVRVVPVPPDWGDWLVHRFADGEFTRVAPLLRLVTSFSESPVERLAALPMPYSPQAKAVAVTILRTPGTALGMADLAQREHISLRTLQRRFLDETSLSLFDWRARARLAVAAAQLRRGRQIGWTGRHVGYRTPAGFTRAFRRQMGITPREYVLSLRDRLRSSAWRSDDPSEAVPGPPAPPRIRPAHRPVQIEERHVLQWAYRGAVTLRIGTRSRRLESGEMIWIPAGTPFQADLAAGAVLIPLGYRRGPILRAPDDLTVFSYPPEAESFLLHIALTEETMLRPSTTRSTFVDDVFRAQFAPLPPGQRPDAPAGAVAAIAAALWRRPGDARTITEWADALRVPAAGLRREFLAQTGMTFPRWRAQLRMDVARELLWSGAAPGRASRRLGYTSTAAFTKAFTSAHGFPPTEYQRREAGLPRRGIG